jgi:peroxiredoxin
MKKTISILIFFLAIVSIARTQSQPKIKAQLSEVSVVKDSSGTVYPYSLWSKLVSSGNFVVRPVNPGEANSEFLLIQLTEEQKQRRLEMMKPQESKYFKTGETVSTFKTTDINGNKINLKDLLGKVVVFNFWFINCPPCRQEMPELNQLVNDYKDSTNVVFIGVALDDKNALKDFLEKTQFDYTIIDNGGFIANRYGVKSFPTHLIIDKAGKVYYHTSGYSMVTVHWVRKSIKELLEE